MRNILFGLSIILSFQFISCNDDCENVGTRNSNEILLKAVVETSSSKSLGPINSGFTTNFPIGIYAFNTAWLAGSTANAINNDNATVQGSAGHGVVFGSGPYYYPSDGSVLNFFAFAPQGTESTAAGAGTPPFVDIPITGLDDVMWCTSTGSKVGSNPAQPPVLNFQHKLTQLQFTFKADATYPSGAVVKSLLVKSQPNVAKMNVATGVCTYSGSADMQALSSSNQTSGIAITTAGTNAGSPIITAPASGATAYVVSIDVKPAGSPTNITYIANVNITSAASSAHMITLTFTRVAVTATATVSDWQTGVGGNVTVL